ncbi:uncharacterized protein FIBRA_04896 [Fibroporia radiculosa]|uniref:Ino eighty subunit 1 n=1 Tax=Fibroporia radiculosa TaxID=599839 RepID=J4HWS8_9APHY|nr:uncharacterized protein FIBRA_04896 [Fibroporia radiculosa]CCM02787.1 predicted protein [Fibroporia radiculosa]
MDSPDFGLEFAKMALLSNVGRINTTMAFFPEMRTALRTYHPVPSLQKTSGNLQDAPRIKNILKSCHLDSETPSVTLSPADVHSRSRSGKVPPTSIVNLVFTFATNAGSIARTHFGRSPSYDFLDFFTPIHISSESRARAFLWLCYHYHEAPSYNPFSDDHANTHPGQIPSLAVLSPEEAALENVDPPDEIEWGWKMTRQRREFMENKAKEGDQEQPDDGDERPKSKASMTRGRGRSKAALGMPSVDLADREWDGEHSPIDDPMSPLSIPQGFQDPSYSRGRSSERLPLFQHEFTPYHETSSSSFPSHQHLPRLPSMSDILAEPHLPSEPYPRRRSSPSPVPSTNGRALRTHGRRHTEPHALHPSAHHQQHVPQHAPLYPHQSYPAFMHDVPRLPPAAQPPPQRSMLDQAWHVVMTTDPLEDSDDEYPDESARLDYVLRLRIISRLRGKDPTPEPEVAPQHQATPIPHLNIDAHPNAI